MPDASRSGGGPPARFDVGPGSAMFGHSRHFNPLICSVCSCSQTGHVQTSELPEMTRAPRHFA
jgi:hypothetical protein